MRDCDFDLIDDLFCKLVDKKEEHGWRFLTAEELVLVLVWHASGIIGNGGFQYFFEQELDAEATACAYETIGCDKCAELLRLSLSLFSRSILQANWKERIQFVEDNKEMFDNLSSAFWEADKQMRGKLAGYARNHKAVILSSNI